MARLTPKRFLNPLGLFFLLTSIYLLTYSGLFRSVDELVLWNMVDRFTQGRPLEPLPLQLAIFHDLHNGVMRRQGWVLICCWLVLSIGRVQGPWGVGGI